VFPHDGKTHKTCPETDDSDTKTTQVSAAEHLRSLGDTERCEWEKREETTK
ncbi:hypothetical protein KUDE01_031278, partial [Dissostichus eleginoides]